MLSPRQKTILRMAACWSPAVVYAIFVFYIFPMRDDASIPPDRARLLNAIFIFILCVTCMLSYMLMRQSRKSQMQL